MTLQTCVSLCQKGNQKALFLELFQFCLSVDAHILFRKEKKLVCYFQQENPCVLYSDVNLMSNSISNAVSVYFLA